MNESSATFCISSILDNIVAALMMKGEAVEDDEEGGEGETPSTEPATANSHNSTVRSTIMCVKHQVYAPPDVQMMDEKMMNLSKVLKFSALISRPNKWKNTLHYYY